MKRTGVRLSFLYESIPDRTSTLGSQGSKWSGAAHCRYGSAAAGRIHEKSCILSRLCLQNSQRTSAALPELILETIAPLAFGISWLIKTLLREMLVEYGAKALLSHRAWIRLNGRKFAAEHLRHDAKHFIGWWNDEEDWLRQLNNNMV